MQSFAIIMLFLQCMDNELTIKGRKLLIANHFADCNNREQTIMYAVQQWGLKETTARAEVCRVLKSPEVVEYLQTRLNMPVSSVTYNPIPEPKPLEPLPSTHQICLELLEKWRSEAWEPFERLEAVKEFLKVTGSYVKHNAQTQTNQLTQINVNIRENGS